MLTWIQATVDAEVLLIIRVMGGRMTFVVLMICL